jgi:methylated-DNA-[protein]-cysteine S-methyltransferase
MTDLLRFLIDHTSTPIGELALIADDVGRLRGLHFADREDSLLPQLRRHYGERGFSLEPGRDPGGVTSALEAYFRGELKAIDALPVETGGTPFQRAVWAALRGIPCGTTVSYSELARRIGRPAAVRAVGLANGANPIAIVLPCHRVVGANGSLTGYGGGLPRKRWLLAHESGAPGGRGSGFLFGPAVPPAAVSGIPRDGGGG